MDESAASFVGRRRTALDVAKPPSRSFPLRTMHVLAVAGTPRFRATQRRAFAEAARHGMVLIVAAALLDCVWLGSLHPDAARAVVAINGIVAAIATACWLVMTSPGRRHVEVVTFVALVVVDVATVALGIIHPGLALVVDGYLLLLPTLVALLIPWPVRIHASWLAVHVAFVLGYVAAAEADPITAGAAGSLLGLLVVAITLSAFGHLLELRARVRSFVQIQDILALNRGARRDQARVERLNILLDDLARTDELTGLRNRASLNADLSVVRSRIGRNDERYGLLLLDLDHFKAINDSLGHVAGDAVLRAAAGAIAGTIRAGDAAYRYGGEEFLVLVRIARPLDALAAAERIRRAVEQLAVDHPGNEPHGRLTVSIGIAFLAAADAIEGDDDWLRRADEALYHAKSAGRNRCEHEPMERRGR